MDTREEFVEERHDDPQVIGDSSGDEEVNELLASIKNEKSHCLEYRGENDSPSQQNPIAKLTCLICHELQTSDQTLKDHYKSHLQYACDKCDKRFVKESLLRKHKSNSHLESKNIECPICKCVFRAVYNLKQHLYTHSEERTFSCTFDGCQLSFRQISSLQAHEKIHKNQHRKKCPICDQMVTKLDTHMWSHSDDKPYKCTECTKSFASKTQLDIHFYSHENDRQFSCELCDASFKFRSSYLKHKSTIHAGTKFPCPVCHRNFNRKDNMNKHKKYVHRILD